jgi:HlyD family secretion protein
MEAPGPYAAGLLALFVVCAWVLGIVSFRQLVYALLALFIGCAGFFLWMGAAEQPGTAEIACFVAWIGALVIITFRELTMRSWVYLITFIAACAAAFLIAFNYRIQTEVNGEGILLTANDTLSLVRAPATGRLLSLRVKEGDLVAPGDEIGEISQDDLREAIREDDSKLSDLQHEDQQLTQMEEGERPKKEGAIARQKQATVRNAEDSFEKTKGSQQVTELGQDRISVEGTRRRALLERRARIRSRETKLSMDRDKLKLTSRVITRVRGRVEQVFVARDELVREDAPLVLLHSPRTQAGAGESGDPPYDSIIFVAASDRDSIDVANFVEVMPATVKREEDGFIHGRVVAVGEQFATRRTIEEALGHPDLADALLKRHAPGSLSRVLVKLQANDPSRPGSARWPDVGGGNLFRWSSSHGFRKRLKSATPCQAAIVVQSRRLITLILPWTARLLGVDP